MYILILILPLLSFIQASIFGFILGRIIVSYLSIILLGLSFFLSCFIFFEVGINNVITILPLYEWLSIDLINIKFTLYFDSLTSIMLLIITFISFLVHVYSIEYMDHDPFLNRFLSYLSLFTFFMLIVVTADNLVQLFIGWEGVGLCSYLLINFWFTRVLANKAALKAMIVNRIADVFFLIGIFLLLIMYGTTDYLIIFNIIQYENNILYLANHGYNSLNVICFFLLFGALGKSAQLIFHTWLPDAMEGPTPVSSLLHAATMVTAGVFLVLRCSALFEYSYFILTIFQWDIKKVIAYSTCSQLGYMFLVCGFSYYYLSIFHLFNHAFFKALLFLSAGSIIHALNDEQDMRKMGGLLNFLPFTYICIFFASLAIMGFPFLTGFYSKDLILELLYSSYIIDSIFFYLLAVTAAFFTAFYSTRLIVFVFLLPANFYKINKPYESGIKMSIALFILLICSIFVGFIFNDLFVGYASSFFNDSLFILPNNNSQINSMLIGPLLRNLPLLISILATILSIIYIYYFNNIKYILKIKLITNFINSMSAFFYNAGYFNIIYNNIFYTLFKNSYYIHTKMLDKGLLEVLGPVGLYRLFKNLSFKIRKMPNMVFLNIGLMFFSLLIMYIISLYYINSDLYFINGIWLIIIAVLYNELNNKY